MVRGGPPKAPPHLEGEALREWRRITRLLGDAGLLTKLDRALVAAYCTAWARWVECETEVKEKGIILRTTGGTAIQSPWLNVANRAMEQMRQLGEQIGLSGSSRSRIKAADPGTGMDAAEMFLSGRR